MKFLLTRKISKYVISAGRTRVRAGDPPGEDKIRDAWRCRAAGPHCRLRTARSDKTTRARGGAISPTKYDPFSSAGCCTIVEFETPTDCFAHLESKRSPLTPFNVLMPKAERCAFMHLSPCARASTSSSSSS